MGLRVLRSEPNRLAEFGDGLVQLPPFVQDIAEVVMGTGVLGSDSDRVAVFGDSVVQLPQAGHGDAQVVVGLGVVRIVPQRPVISAIASSIFPVSPSKLPRLTWASTRAGLRRSSPVLGDRLIPMPLIVQGLAQAIVGLGAVGLEAQCVPEFGDGLVQLPLFLQVPPGCCGPRGSRA